MKDEELVNWIKELYKTGNIKKFYDSNLIWRAKRREILERDNNECQMCKDRGKYTPATTVHHIKHLDKYPWLALVDSNLISLCNECHNRVHPEKLEKYYKKRNENKFSNEERW